MHGARRLGERTSFTDFVAVLFQQILVLDTTVLADSSELTIMVNYQYSVAG